MDIRIVNGCQNQAPIVAASVLGLARNNAVAVVQVNVSGDIVNPGGAGAGGGGVSQISDGVSTGILTTVRNYTRSNPIAVVLTNASGDTYNASGGSGGGGDGAILDGSNASIKATVLSGPGKPGGSANQLVVQIADDSTRQIGQTSPPVTGVQIVGGGLGAVTGDVTVRPSTSSNIGSHPVTGDMAIVDGTTRTTKVTVKSYADSNPLAVVIVNPSGDAYLPVPKEPVCQTIPFSITSLGSTVIAGPYTGRVIKVCAYDLQGSSDIATAQGHFGSAVSGSQLTHDWLLAVREGVAKQVPAVGGGYIFKTLLNQSLVLELSSGSIRGSVTFHTGDSL